KEKALGRSPRVGPGPFPTIVWPEASKVPPPWEGGDGRATNEKPRKSKVVASGIRLAPESPGSNIAEKPIK
ncbi:MAG: hypothetical protein ABIP63_05825, partial [Thermoanaerobaculia bacterium]